MNEADRELVEKTSLCFYSSGNHLEKRVPFDSEKDIEDLRHKIMNYAPASTAMCRFFRSFFERERERISFKSDISPKSPYYFFRGLRLKQEDLKEPPYFFPQQAKRVSLGRNEEQQDLLTETERREELKDIVKKKLKIYVNIIPEYTRELYNPIQENNTLDFPIEDIQIEKGEKKKNALFRSMEKYPVYIMATDSGVYEYGFARQQPVELIGEAKEFQEKLCREQEKEKFEAHLQKIVPSPFK